MDVKIPNLGEGADSGTVVNVFVKEGDKIEKDQPVIELENEKAVATIPSTASGVVAKIHVKNGDKVNVGQTIISITADKGGAAPATKATEAPASPAATPQKEQAPAKDAAPEEKPDDSSEVASPSNVPVAAAPSVRKLAEDLGIDLRLVRGTASGGRIVLSDIRDYIQRLVRAASQPIAGGSAKTADKPASEPVDFSKWGEISRKPLSSLRKVIGRRMSESWNAVPRVTQFDDADLTTLLELQKKHAGAYEKSGTRLTVTGFVLKAVVATLEKHPLFNSSLDEAAGEIVFKQYYHIGIAVDTEAGLIVPVIRDVNKKKLVEVSRELEELARKARERKVSADELKGGTFTISNQGGIGGAHFTPIVNTPEVAILGLGRGAMKAVVRNGNIEPRMMLPMALSYDHRIIDGGEAARFMVDFVKAVQEFKEESVKP